MKPHHDFAAERALAQHCAELFAPERGAEDKDENAARFAEQLQLALPDVLKPLLVGRRPSVTVERPATQTAASLVRELGRPSASYVIAGAEAARSMLVTFDIATAIALTDRLFGGDGKIAGEPQANLPFSSALAIEKIVGAVAQAAGEQAPAITRSSDPSELLPFPKGDYCVAWDFTVAQESFDPWTMKIAVLEAALTGGTKVSPAPADTLARRTISEAAEITPFDSVPIELTALLAEMKLPIARVAALAPGDVLPLAPRREIPLLIGSEMLAHGSIGMLDESVALQLTRIS